jgi:ceramide glucosyltransferase
LPFFLSILNNSTLWPLLWLAAARRPLAWAVCGGCILFRVATALQQQSRLTQSPARAAYAWMPPVKDLLDVLVWAWAFCGNQITWRGGRYRILPGGQLAKASSAPRQLPDVL